MPTSYANWWIDLETARSLRNAVRYHIRKHSAATTTDANSFNSLGYRIMGGSRSRNYTLGELLRRANRLVAAAAKREREQHAAG